MKPITATLSNGVWQIMISASLFVASVLISELHSVATPTTSPVPVLIYIGAVLALTGSVSFGFVVYQLNYSNSRKNDLYFKFKAALFEFDRFLKDYPVTIKLVDDAAELSWELKKLRNTDFPLMNWEDRLKGMAAYWNKEDPAYPADIQLENKILGYLAYFEEMVSEIGIMCIRQILIVVYTNIVRKVFSLLATLVLIPLSSPPQRFPVSGARV